MQPEQLTQSYLDNLVRSYPSLASQNGKIDAAKSFNSNLISDFVLQLPRQVLLDAQNFVKELFQLRQSEAYQTSIKAQHPEFAFTDPGNRSMLMCYDFHYTLDDGLKLIEVNTNASFLLLGFNLYQTKNVPLPIDDFNTQEIVSDIRNELKLFGSKTNSIFIIDDQPQDQKLYLEFLCYQNLFQSSGFDVQIQDYQKPINAGGFCYNRWTDFYFQKPESQNLKLQFQNKEICFSPNPYEYMLLADKRRFIDFYKYPKLQKFILKTEIITPENQTEIWNNRKSYFIKPMNSFGSKQSYRGASVSKKMFETLCDGRFIAQEFAQPGAVDFPVAETTQSFKFDLRFYAYQERVQFAIARLYQGQVTNSQTPYGGFACIQFI